MTLPLLFTLCVLASYACGPVPEVVLPTDPLPPAPGVSGQCAATCEHWRELKCIEGQPSPDLGVPCETVCENTEEFEGQPHACFQAARTCKESRRCE
jgi:hypothetical protein